MYLNWDTIKGYHKCSDISDITYITNHVGNKVIVNLEYVNQAYLTGYLFLACRSRNFCFLSGGISSKLMPWLLALRKVKDRRLNVLFDWQCTLSTQTLGIGIKHVNPSI